MNPSKEEALAILKARGVDPSNPPPQLDSTGVSKEEARQALLARGVDPSQSNSGGILNKVGNVGMGALETLGAPFQVAGEAIRGAGEGEPLKVATADDQSGFRAPSILQRIMPSLKTNQPPADPFQKSYQGLEGLTQLVANLPKGVQNAAQTASNTVTGEPDLAANIGGLSMALGTGEAGNAPFTAAVNATKGAAGLAPKFAKFANVIKDVDPEVVQLSQKYNVPLSAASQTGGGTQGAVENFLSRMPFSKDIIKDSATNTIQALDKNVRQPLIQNAAKAEDLGPAIQQSFSDASNAAYKNAQSLYSNAGAAIPQGVTITAEPIHDVAENLLKAQLKLPASSRATGAVPILEELSGRNAVNEALKKANIPAPDLTEHYLPSGEKVNLPEHGKLSAQEYQDKVDTIRKQVLGEHGYDYETLQGIRADLNDRILKGDAALKTQTPGAKGMSSPEAALFRKLRGAIDNSLTEYSDNRGGGFKQAFENASQNYSKFKQTFKDNKFIQSIIREQDPSKVVDKALNLDNPKAVELLKQNLPTETMNSLQDTFVKDLTEPKEGKFSPARVVTQYENYGPDKLQAFLGPQKFQQLTDLYKISKAATAAERIGGNASGTGQAMMGAMGLTAPFMQLVRGHPISAAGLLAGEASGLPLAAKAYLSKPATNLLTNKTNVIGDAANAAQNLAPAAKLQPNIQALIQQLQDKFAKRRQF